MDLQVIESQVTQQVLNLTRNVQIDWLMVKNLELLLAQETKRVELKELAAGLANMQQKAGNISELNARKRDLDFEQATERLKFVHVKLENAVEKLSRTLGLFGPEACFKVSGDIDWKNDIKLPDIITIENAAINNRPDLETIRREIIAIANESELSQPWTYTKIKIGTSAEKEPEGFTVAGPLVELYGQRQAIKYAALIDQAQKKLLAKAIEGCSEVRKYFKEVNIFFSQVFDYDRKILPDLAQQVIDAQAHYNVMALGVYELLDIKESEIQATIEQLNALKNYEKARIELYHSAGGSFASIRAQT